MNTVHSEYAANQAMTFSTVVQASNEVEIHRVLGRQGRGQAAKAPKRTKADLCTRCLVWRAIGVYAVAIIGTIIYVLAAI